MFNNYLIDTYTKLFILIHDWYPANCCSNHDCKPVPCDEITQSTDGLYHWFNYTFASVQPSLDNLCHTCINSIGKGTCLFLQYSM